MSELQALALEAQEALQTIWFLRSLEEVDRTDLTLSLRLHIRPSLFVQIFYGQLFTFLARVEQLLLEQDML